jgi:geranylgeranyl reductase family protein
MAKPYDVLIVGAGPAGSAVAWFLAAGGLHVAMIDKFNFPRDKTCGDGLTPRAIKMLNEMDILPKVEQCAQRCSAITIRHSDEITYRMPLSDLKDLPPHVLVLPRLKLDHMLVEHAIAAGAELISRVKVSRLTHAPDGMAQVETEDGQRLECRLVILATGSNAALLREHGLLKKTPPINLAARTYFENVEGLDDSIVLFFDEVDLPGYGWVFPTGPGAANVGCGVFFDAPTPQPSQLREMIQRHTYLSRILRNARQLGPIKGYPLRTDFSPSNGGNDWIVVVGEALGLVNPLTGEGIDYALESAQLAARVILNEWDGRPSKNMQRHYRAALAGKFQSQLMFHHLGQRIYFRNGIFNTLIARAQSRLGLRQAILDTCFGASNPATLFTPRTIWDIFGP